jgi:ribosomal protein S18 acetylase RimI-like enzyme
MDQPLERRLMRKSQLLCFHVLELTRENLVRWPPPRPDVTVGELTAAAAGEIDAVAAMHFYAKSRSAILHCLGQRQRCHLCKCGERVAGFVWSTTEGYYDEYLNRTLRLTATEEYVFGAFTAEEFRGQGLFPYLMGEVLARRWSEDPDRRVVAFVRWNNSASLRSFAKLGFRPVGRIGVLALFGVRLHALLRGRGQDVLPAMTHGWFLERA